MMPTRMEEELKKVLPECLHTRMTTSTKMASSRFSVEPKSLAVLPPPKEFTPTEIRLRPMESTTVPVTTGGRSLRRGFKKKPSTVSNRPPMMEAPIMAP